jgi:hypothetical protein
MYLYLNPSTHRAEVFPWDNDATFGLHWSGEYKSWLETVETGTFLDYNTIYRRLVRFERWRNLFWSYVNAASTSGFAFLDELIEEIRADLRHDVLLDRQKPGSMADFDQAVVELRQFMANRAQALAAASGASVPALYDYQCSTGFAPGGGDEVIFTARSTAPQKVVCRYIDDLDFETHGASYTKQSLPLYDDGQHRDGAAGDLVYGNVLKIPDSQRGLLPYTFTAGNRYYPENGFLYANYYRTHLLVLNAMNRSPEIVHELTIGGFFGVGRDRFVEIRNNADVDVDISYCNIQSGEYYKRTVLPERTIVPSRDRLIVATDRTRAASLFSQAVIADNVCFSFEVGDTIKLLAPDSTPIAARRCETLINRWKDESHIVINEICYNAPEEANSGDWVELHNVDVLAVDLSGWVLTDSDDHHRFFFPNGTLLAAGDFVVIVAEEDKFVARYPGMDKRLAGMPFGLGGMGDALRLFDENGGLIDSLTYDDRSPWPEAPDGNGSTLALTNPLADNAVAANWAASPAGGTPGSANVGVFSLSGDGLVVEQNRPNPFSSSTSIPFSLALANQVKIDIYNVVGQHVTTLLDAPIDAGTHVVEFGADIYPSGLYFYRAKTSVSEVCGKLVLLK